MVNECGDCSNALPKNGNYVTCLGGCSTKFHFQCSGLSKETWKAKSETKKKEWRCKKCRLKNKSKDESPQQQETTSGESTNESDIDSEDDGPTRKKKLVKKGKNNKKEFYDRLVELETKVNEMTKTLEYLSSENDEIKKQNKLLRDDMKKIKEENDIMKSNGRELKKSVDDTKLKFQKQDQNERNKNIELCGVEQSEGENLKEIIDKMAQIIRIEEFNMANVENVHRVKRRKEKTSSQGQKINDRPENIILQFKEHKYRDEWIEKKRQGLCNNDLFENGNETRIFINEHLTFEAKVLLMKTKKRAKEFKWSFTWVKNGKILCRKKEGDRVIAIEKEEDILNIR